MIRAHRIGSHPTSRLLAEYSIPAVAAMMSLSACSIIDRIYAGNGAGTMGIAGITVCAPVIALYTAFSMLAGTGGASLYSIRTGQGKNREADSVIRNTFILLAVISLALSAVSSYFMNGLLYLCGAKNASLFYASSYLRIMLIALPVQVIGFGMNNIIRAQGSPGTAMVTVLISASGCIVFTPVFVFLFHMGTAGNALGYLCAQSAAFFWVARYFLHMTGLPFLTVKHLLPDKGTMKQVLYCGTGSFCIQVCSVIVAVSFNLQLARYGDVLSLPLFGIIHCVSSFLLMPVIGISQGVQPLIGYNHGAGKFSRVKEIFMKSAGVSTLVIACGVCVVMAGPAGIIRLFTGSSSGLTVTGPEALRTFMFLLPLAGVQVCAVCYFTATGRPVHSAVLTFSRQILFLLPMLLLLPHYFGIRGIWIAAPVSDLASFILAVLMLSRETNLNKKILERPAMDSHARAGLSLNLEAKP